MITEPEKRIMNMILKFIKESDGIKEYQLIEKLPVPISLSRFAKIKAFLMQKYDMELFYDRSSKTYHWNELEEKE